MLPFPKAYSLGVHMPVYVALHSIPHCQANMHEIKVQRPLMICYAQVVVNHVGAFKDTGLLP